MPVFQLTEELVFPHPNLADEDGLLAIGGDLSLERLLLAYQNGIFPWPYGEKYPLTWASPNPRLVLFPDNFKEYKSLKTFIKKNIFKVTIDTAFKDVIKRCSSIKRSHEKGTWITKAIVKAYTQLHEAGLAHSFETWQDGKLVGGLYGVSMGRAFFGESMFSEVSNASKVALYHLVKLMKHWNFDFIDAQVTTNHFLFLGAVEISRNEYLKILKKSLNCSSKIGKWNFPDNLQI